MKTGRWHIVVIVVLVGVITSVVALNISFNRTLQMETAELFNKQQLLLARAEASNIQAFIGKIRDDMLRVSQFLSMIQFNNETLYEFLTGVFFKDVKTEKIGISFLDNKGKVLFNQGVPIDAAAYRKDLADMAGQYCDDNALIRQDTKNVSIIAPVCRFNSLAGAVITTLDIQDLARVFLGPLKSGERGYAWMMDGNGNLLYHPTQPMMVGRNLYNTDTSCFQCHKSFDVEKRIIEGTGDFSGKYVAATGEDKVLAFSTVSVGDSKWIVAVSSPYSEITMSMHASMKFQSWLNIMIFLIASIVSAMLIDMNRKRVQAQEVARYQKQLEKHAEDLETQVAIRTQELTTEKEKLNTVIGAIGSGIILIDNHRTILWINDTMKSIVGRDITGMRCDDFFADCKIIASYKSNDMQTDVLSDLFGKKDKYFQVTTAPVKGGTDGIQGYIRLVNDVTDLKKMEEQMMHSEKLALLGRLTTGIVNEIGNPLTSVFSFIQMLKVKERNEFKRESLETIDFHMNSIADALKRLSGFSRTPPIEFRPEKGNSIIENALSLIQHDTRVNAITIVKDLQSDIPKIVTDSNLLSQVFVNIVLHSADAMTEGGTLIIRSSTGPDGMMITFEDSGIGIPKEKLARIFDPLYTTNEKGTGLGLAVSQNIIEKLNGTLTVESELNKGTRFVISLPSALHQITGAES